MELWRNKLKENGSKLSRKIEANQNLKYLGRKNVDDNIFDWCP